MSEHILHPNPTWSIRGGIQDGRDLQIGIQSFDILPPDKVAGLYRVKFWDRGAAHVHGISLGPGFKRNYEAAQGPSLWSSAKSLFGGPDPNPARSDEAPIQAYWLPYQMNRTFETDLGSGAQYFFTAGLSGCTVVVSGSPQAPHVAHINRMDGPELEQMHAKFNPDGPRATKSEVTQRSVMLQEMQAVAAARAAGRGAQMSAGIDQALAQKRPLPAPQSLATLRGTNFGQRTLNPNAASPVLAGGSVQRGTGDLYFGVCDFAHHYQGAGEFDVLAQVSGFRNMNTGNWRFFYQALASAANQQEPSYYARGALKCLICKTTPDACVCLR